MRLQPGALGVQGAWGTQPACAGTNLGREGWNWAASVLFAASREHLNGGPRTLKSPVAQVVTVLQRRQVEPTLRHYSQALLFWVTPVLGCEAMLTPYFPDSFENGSPQPLLQVAWPCQPSG